LFSNGGANVYTSAYLLSGQTHHAALEVIDAAMQSVNTALSNINNNCGGNVTTGAMSGYSSTNYLTDGESHHVSLGVLDSELKSVSDASGQNNTDITEQTTRVDNLVAKVGTDSDLAAGFDYSSNNFIVDDESYKEVAEKLDQVVLGSKRTAEHAFSNSVQNWKEIKTATEQWYDTFYDASKYKTPESTCSFNHYEQKISGDGTYYYATETFDSSVGEAAFKWNTNGEGTLVVKYNLINSYDDADMVTVGSQNTFVAAASAGTGFVVKLELTGTIEIYSVATIAKAV
jgi:hypothetical protein